MHFAVALEFYEDSFTDTQALINPQALNKCPFTIRAHILDTPRNLINMSYCFEKLMLWGHTSASRISTIITTLSASFYYAMTHCSVVGVRVADAHLTVTNVP